MRVLGQEMTTSNICVVSSLDPGPYSYLAQDLNKLISLFYMDQFIVPLEPSQ